MKNDTSAWTRVASHARTARTARTARPEPDAAAPFGFATRLAAQWAAVRESERRLALWQRLSWRAALASLALGAAVVLTQRTPQRGPLLEAPAIPLPGALQ